ncbi:MAG: phosphonate ABC transporter, permease protein PhnE [Bacilli bacterium]|nr:phosphonate ABC transporter, permease protein PhnE [Bacilli bacterium]
MKPISGSVQTMYGRQPRKWVINTVFSVLFIGLLVFTFVGSSINMSRINNLSYTLGDMLSRIYRINWEIFFGYGTYSFDQGVVYKVLETFAIGFIGTLLGAILAIPLGFLAAESLVGKKLAKISEAIILIIRVFPEIILAIILVKGFGMNAFTGMLTIGLHSIGMLGKLFSEAIDNMDRSSFEALDSVGANIWLKIRYGILPNILPDFTSITLYRLDINVRAASILGLVGAGGIGASLMIATSMWSWEYLGTILLAVIILVLLVDFISSSLRKKLV